MKEIIAGYRIAEIFRRAIVNGRQTN